MSRFTIILFFLFFSQGLHATSPAAKDELEFANPPVQQTSLHYIKTLADDLYQVQVSEGLYFVIERVSSEAQRAHWDACCENAKVALEKSPEGENQGDDQARQHFVHLSKDALSFFSEGINFQRDASAYWATHQDELKGLPFDPKKQETWLDFQIMDTWVAYASNVCRTSQDDFYTSPCFERIEMSFVILTQNDAPFTTHQGIFRNPAYAGETHRGISIKLHALSARVMQMRYPAKLYMATLPLHTMKALFLNRIDDPVAIEKWKSRFDFQESTRELTVRPEDENTIIYQEIYPQWLPGHAFVIPLRVLSTLA